LLLTKPLDSQFIVSTRYFVPWRLVSVVAGLGLVGYAAWRLDAAITPVGVALFLLLLACALTIVYCVMLGVMTLCFWFVRLENLMALLWSFWEMGRYPITVYRGVLRFALTYLVPVAFVTTVPAQAVTGRLTASAVFAAMGVAMGLLLVTRWFWLFGLRHYTSASS
jgi:ABC-2 type transport system permease protein